MKNILNLYLPTAWSQLSDKQLRFVFHILSTEHSMQQVKTLCLLKWSDIIVLHREGALFIVEHKGKEYPLSALQVMEASSALDWLGDIPSFPVRLSRIGFHRPVRADFQGVSFGDFLFLDNLYQGYLQTQSKDILTDMAKIMYNAKKIRLNRAEETCIFYWFTAVKLMFSRLFKHFLKSATTDDFNPTTPSLQQLRESMDTQIRALTGGDITKEKDVLAMDCWRALTELDAKAREYEDMKHSS